MSRAGLLVLAAAASTELGCGDEDEGRPPAMMPSENDDPVPSRLPFAEAVERFSPGPGAGFGSQDFPNVVLGPPTPGGLPSLDVLSLGAGGEIVVDFGADRRVFDGPGPDLVVFENPFFIGGDETMPFAELAEVSVSTDAVSWRPFTCTTGEAPGTFPGCAGWTPTGDFDPTAPFRPEESGGDQFDLDEIGGGWFRFVRILDLGVEGDGMTVGFDLDAVGGFHIEVDEG